jgi:hypothetical protein
MTFEVFIIDGTPNLTITAQTAFERAELQRVVDGFKRAREGAASGRAGPYNVCGSTGVGDGCESLSVDLALGGAKPVYSRWG